MAAVSQALGGGGMSADGETVDILTFASGKQTGLEVIPELWPPLCLPRASPVPVAPGWSSATQHNFLETNWVLDSVRGAGRDSHGSSGFGGCWLTRFRSLPSHWHGCVLRAVGYPT